MAPVFSVVMPAYNSERYLEAAVRSALAQTLTELEVIIADNGSTDRTAAIAGALAKEDSRVVLLDAGGKAGAAFARNTAVSAARGEYVAFLDSDDLWMPEKLERQYEAMRDGDDVICCTAAQCIGADGTVSGRRFDVPDRTDRHSLMYGNVVVTSSAAVRREDALRCPMKSGPFHEDLACWLSMLENGGTVRGIREPLTLYRLTPHSLSRNKLHSAVMTWRTYGEAGIPPFRRLAPFAGYITHGLRRYCGKSRN